MRNWCLPQYPADSLHHPVDSRKTANLHWSPKHDRVMDNQKENGCPRSGDEARHNLLDVRACTIGPVIYTYSNPRNVRIRFQAIWRFAAIEGRTSHDVFRVLESEY